MAKKGPKFVATETNLSVQKGVLTIWEGQLQ